MNAVIVIGGGAAGLMTAYELSKHKIPVTILEAKKRLGGRIHTLSDTSFSQPVEAGAEFIHGDLPLTISLLKEAGITYHEVNDTMFRLEKGKLEKEDDFAEHWGMLITTMEQLNKDMTLRDFLNKYFSDDKYAQLRESVKAFAGGFDLADISTASTKALCREWSKEIGTQYRIDGGYKKLVDYLETYCRDNNCVISPDCCAKKVSWSPNEVNVLTMCSRIYKAARLVVTAPVSVLQANTDSENYLEFTPSIPQHTGAAKNIGFGAVIKIILEFSEPFWQETKKDAGFIFMDEAIPTWWTQLPAENNILTGWLGGEKALALKDETDEAILGQAIQSLANAFQLSTAELYKNLKASKIANWCNEPDINGGYSFATLQSTTAKDVLRQPINDTIFFAGEALFAGVSGGTVEAALHSAKNVAAQVLKTL